MSYTPVQGLFRVRMASTANLTLSGTQTIDAIVGVSGDLVLAKDQTTGSQNGLYVMVAGAWSRLAGADNAAELPAGSLVVVSVGTANAGKIFELTTAAGFVVGTNTLTFTLATNAAALALASTAPANISGVAAVGVGTTAARADHVHALNAAFTSADDETATFPLSLQWINGTNTTVDLTTPGKIKINTTGAGPSPATTVTDVAPTGPSVVGTGGLYARNDHAHFHGDLPGGDLHALVNAGESGLPGFMSLDQSNRLAGMADNATNTPIEGDNVPEEIVDATGGPGVGTTASAWDHVHAHGLRGAGTDASPLHTLATNSAPGFMAAADHSALALWDVTKCRYYFVDNEAGNDTHTGFLDRTPGHDFGGGEAAAVAAAKIKTVERLLQILPRNGNGRMAKILFKNRASGTCYLMADGVTLADLDLTGVHGYRWLGRCGSTDFENGTNDMTNVGAVISVDGPNGDFSFTTSFATTSSLVAAAGSFGTDDANTIGWRVRFKGNVTPALANVCMPIYRITSTTQLAYGHVPPDVAAVGDDFFIERIGVTFNNIFDMGSAATMTASDASTEMVSPMVGLQAQADTGGGQFRMGVLGKTQYAFCSSRNAGGAAVPRAFSNPDAGHIVLSDVYRDEIGQEWPVGPCKVDDTLELQAATVEIAQGGCYCSTHSLSRTVSIKTSNLTVGHGTQFKRGLFVELAGAGPNRFGDGNTTAPIRMGGTDNLGAALYLRAGSAALICDGITFDSVESSSDYGVVVTGGPRPGFNAEAYGSGPNVSFAHVDDNGGGGSLVMKGISVENCWQGRFFIDDLTVGIGGSAAAGVTNRGETAISCTMPFAAFGKNNLVDFNGNELQGSAGRNNTGFVFVKALGTDLTLGALVALQGNLHTPPDAYLQASDFVANPFAGMAMWTILDGQRGWLVTHGTPYSKDLSGEAPGNLVYVSCDVAGDLTTTSPTVGVGRYKYRVGIVWPPSNILLRIDNAGELADGNP